MLAVANGRWNFSVSARTRTIVPTARESRFGRTRAKKWIRLQNSCVTLAGKTLKVPKFARTTVRVTTPSFSRTPMATNSKFAVARSRCLRVNLWRLRPSRFCRLHVCRYTWEVADLRTKNPAHHEPAILQGARRVRYLKLIALFKIGKGVLLLVLGLSLLFLNARTRWMDALSDWTADEILLEHSKAVHYLLNNLQAVLAGGVLRATGLLALFYTAVLFTEGIGVYMQQRWAELLMIFATAALIPLEVRHIWHHPGVVGALILLANCFIVWFLYRVLKRDKTKPHVAKPRELVETSVDG